MRRDRPVSRYTHRELQFYVIRVDPTLTDVIFDSVHPWCQEMIYNILRLCDGTLLLEKTYSIGYVFSNGFCHIVVVEQELCAAHDAGFLAVNRLARGVLEEEDLVASHRLRVDIVGAGVAIAGAIVG
jgi:hypothetical protein